MASKNRNATPFYETCSKVYKKHKRETVLTQFMQVLNCDEGTVHLALADILADHLAIAAHFAHLGVIY